MPVDWKTTLLSGIFILQIFNSIAQSIPRSFYGLAYINSVPKYKISVSRQPEKKMIALSPIPGILLDLRYASKNNFMGRCMYPENTRETYLRAPAYRALYSVVSDLRRRGLTVVIFDAYRPYSVTEAFWELVKDARYAADPAKGSGHNRGVSVDLSLADLKSHQLLPMPTSFDHFSDSAHLGFMDPDSTKMQNRDLLNEVMKKYGFVPLPTEWWHFSWPKAETFDVLDLSFKQLASLAD